MLSLLLFYLCLCAVSLALCALADRRFEQSLPISCMSFVLLLFVLGLAVPRGLSQAGTLCLVFAVAAPAAAVWALRRRGRGLGGALRRFFTPAFFLFSLAYVYLTALNYGRLCYEFDALSHWGDTVKAMFQTGALATSPLNEATFPSYLPGVSLFQLMEQRLGFGDFAEWRLYHAFQVFALALLLPLLRELDFKKAWAWLCALALLLAPCFLFEGIYRFIYVDPLLGLLSAAGLAAVLLEERRDGFYRAYVLLCAATLVLVKDAGLGLAAVLLLVFLVREYQAAGERPVAFVTGRKALCLLSLGALLLPWGAWRLSVSLNGAARAFPDKIDWGQLLRVLSFQDDSYRKGVRDLFFSALIENPSTASLLGVKLSFVLAFAVVLTALLFVCKQCRRHMPERAGLFRLLYLLSLGELALYMLGILIMYLFKFSPYEAMQLASMERYVAVPLLSLWMLTVFLALALLGRFGRDKTMAAALLLCLVLAATPNSALLGLTNRQAVAASVAARQPATALEQAFTARYQGPPARLYYLSQEDAEYRKFMTKFSLRPHSVSASLGWSLGEEPFYQGDVWTRPCQPEELQETLRQDYDFLLVLQMNEDFKTRFAGLFEEPGDIGPMRIFAVDPQSGLLRLYAVAEG